MSGTTGRIGLTKGLRGALLLSAALGLAACEGTKMPFGIGSGSGSAEGAPVRQASSATLVDRDVEAPEVFEVSDQGLWDGRPSLGGVWVAHPDVKDPERVIIRNPANGKFIIGALFRRERDMPGPRLQVSSDAAGALDMLAGQPAALQVTALRREEAAGAAVAETDPALAAAEPIEATPIGAVASAAIDRADPPATPSASANIPAAPKPAAAPATPAATSGRPYIQIGIFSVEANADRAAGQMKSAGLTPTIRKDESQGKTFWRVIVGPLTGAEERTAAVAKVKSLGYPDAYAVSK
nr:SPOR domain-containing protein [Frigidibacter sp.]